MNAEEFSRQLQQMYERAANLYGRTSVPIRQEPELAADSLEELRIALEELHVAEEEMLAQNEALASARMELEIERRRYYELFDFAPDGYIVTDALGIIREANRAAARMLNVSQQFLVGKPLLNFIPPSRRRVFRLQLQQLQKIDQLQEWEVQISPRHSVDFDAALTVGAIHDINNQLIGWRWLMRDITKRKQSELQLRKAELQNLQLQEAARLKSHFLAVMSHELRSPLNAIIGFSQLLLRYTQQSDKQQNMVQRILTSGKNLLRLIDDILDFSKLEADCLLLKPEEFNLTELVRTTIEEMRSLSDQKNLTLTMECNLENHQVYNDCNRLRQILVNLTANAIKFTDSGGVEVIVSELPEDRIAIAVKDTGIGIAPTDIENIFKEFRQVSQTLERQYTGAGLGLTICDRLVRLMGGTITAESQLDHGSTFRVELPRRLQAGDQETEAKKLHS